MRAPETDGSSIVMIGSFNPTIFQPQWFGAQQLIRPEEAETARITTIQAEVADFSTEWFQLQVLQRRFQLSSVDPRQSAPLRDLVTGVMTILPHTPVEALGINRQFHFKCQSLDAWHAIGHRLAPKEPWNDILDRPGLRMVLMEGYRKQGGDDTLRIKVEPSTSVQNGVYIEVNEEFKANDQERTGAQWVPKRLAEHWEAFMAYAETVADHLLSLVRD